MTSTKKSTEQGGAPRDPNLSVLDRTFELIRTHEVFQVIETSESMEVVNKLTHLACTDAARTFKSTFWHNKRPDVVYCSSVDEMRFMRLIPRETVQGKGGRQVVHKYSEMVEGNGDYDPSKRYLPIPHGNPVDLPHPNEVNNETPSYWRGSQIINPPIEQRDEGNRLELGDAVYGLPDELKWTPNGNMMRIQDSMSNFNSKTAGRGRIYVIDNAELFLTSIPFVHFLKNLAHKRRSIQLTGIFVIFLVPRGFKDFPSELSEACFRDEWNLPDKSHWRQYVKSALGSFTKKEGSNLVPMYPNGMTEVELERVVTALAGMSTERGVASVLLSKQKFGDINSEYISEEKVKHVKDAGIELRIPNKAVKLGGVDNLEKLIELVQYASTPSAKAYGANPPALIFKAGPPGTGKTAAAEQISYETQRPIIRVESNQLHQKYVGEAEKFLSLAFHFAKAMGAILFFDEIEKQIRKVTDGDGGTSNSHTNSSLQLLLTRIQDIRNDPENDTLVIMTANRIDGVAPELLRRAQGTKYYYGLPSPTEQEDIFKIHISRIKRNGEARDWSHFEPIVKELIHGNAKRTAGMSGSTIATVVEQAIMLAGMRSQNTEEPNYDDFVAAIEGAEGESMSKEEVTRIYQECKAKGFRTANSDDGTRETEVADLVSADTGRGW